jgi:hypothetical protein
MKIDIIKANAAIDAYIAELRAPSSSPRGVSSLYRNKILLEKHGVIESWRKLDFLDHCVLWAACIVACKRVREVSRIEKEQHAVTPGKSLEGTLRKWRNRPHHFDSLLTRLDKHLTDTRDLPIDTTRMEIESVRIVARGQSAV